MSGLPEGWVEVELGEVWREFRARVRPGAITPTKYIGLEHVKSGTNRIAAKGCSDDVKSAAAVFSEGDVLYGRLRPYLNKVIRPSFGGVASTEFFVFRETPALANALLLHLLSSSDLVAYASANSAGVNLPRISVKRLAKYRFLLAPLPEQHRIAARIESLFAKLDDGVAALKRAEANLARYRASRWMLLWLLSPLGRRTVLAVASSTSGLHTLSLSKVRALPVPLAPMREQACAVSVADSLSELARVVHGQTEAETGIQALRLRQSILKRAFEGRLVPRDPTDEPASALLERIRAERETVRKQRKRRRTTSRRQP